MSSSKSGTSSLAMITQSSRVIPNVTTSWLSRRLLNVRFLVGSTSLPRRQRKRLLPNLLTKVCKQKKRGALSFSAFSATLMISQIRGAPLSGSLFTMTTLPGSRVFSKADSSRGPSSSTFKASTVLMLNIVCKRSLLVLSSTPFKRSIAHSFTPRPGLSSHLRTRKAPSFQRTTGGIITSSSLVARSSSVRRCSSTKSRPSRISSGTTSSKRHKPFSPVSRSSARQRGKWIRETQSR